MSTLTKVWVDTDIGTDVDDMLALIYALKNPELSVVGVSTVHAVARKRAGIAARVAELCRQTPIIVAGEDYPMSGDRSYTGLGFEGDGICLSSSGISNMQAHNHIRDIFSSQDIKLACIAPLTNVAIALGRVPEVKNEFYIMGRSDSYNMRSDAIAADRIMNNGYNITLVTTEISKRVYLTKEELFNIKTGNAELDSALYANARNWLRVSKYKEMGLFYLYDPLTVVAVAKPELVTISNIDGIKTITDVDVKGFKRHFLDVIAA